MVHYRADSKANRSLLLLPLLLLLCRGHALYIPGSVDPYYCLQRAVQLPYGSQQPTSSQGGAEPVPGGYNPAIRQIRTTTNYSAASLTLSSFVPEDASWEPATTGIVASDYFCTGCFVQINASSSIPPTLVVAATVLDFELPGVGSGASAKQWRMLPSLTHAPIACLRNADCASSTFWNGFSYLGVPASCPPTCDTVRGICVGVATMTCHGTTAASNCTYNNETCNFAQPLSSGMLRASFQINVTAESACDCAAEAQASAGTYGVPVWRVAYFGESNGACVLEPACSSAESAVVVNAAPSPANPAFGTTLGAPSNATVFSGRSPSGLALDPWVGSELQASPSGYGAGSYVGDLGSNLYLSTGTALPSNLWGYVYPGEFNASCGSTLDCDSNGDWQIWLADVAQADPYALANTYAPAPIGSACIAGQCQAVYSATPNLLGYFPQGTYGTAPPVAWSDSACGPQYGCDARLGVSWGYDGSLYLDPGSTDYIDLNETLYFNVSDGTFADPCRMGTYGPGATASLSSPDCPQALTYLYETNRYYLQPYVPSSNVTFPFACHLMITCDSASAYNCSTVGMVNNVFYIGMGPAPDASEQTALAVVLLVVEVLVFGASVLLTVLYSPKSYAPL